MSGASEELALLRSDADVRSYQNSPLPDSWVQRARAKVGELVRKDQRKHRIEWLVTGLGAAACATCSALTWKFSLWSGWGWLSLLGATLSGTVGFVGLCMSLCHEDDKSERTICKVVMDDQRTQNLIQRLTSGTLRSFADLTGDPLLSTSDFKEYEFMKPQTVHNMGWLVCLRQLSTLCLNNPDQRELFQGLEDWIEAQFRSLQQQCISKEVPTARVHLEANV